MDSACPGGRRARGPQSFEGSVRPIHLTYVSSSEGVCPTLTFLLTTESPGRPSRNHSSAAHHHKSIESIPHDRCPAPKDCPEAACERLAALVDSRRRAVAVGQSKLPWSRLVGCGAEREIPPINVQNHLQQSSSDKGVPAPIGFTRDASASTPPQHTRAI